MKRLLAILIGIMMILGLSIVPLPAQPALAQPDLHFNVDVNQDFVNSQEGWVTGTTITITINDPTTVKEPDYSTTTIVDLDGGTTPTLSVQSVESKRQGFSLQNIK